MNDIETIIKRVQNSPDCVLYPPSDTPIVKQEHVLPEDVLAFYQLCGGGMLYDQSEYLLQLVPPGRFVPASPVMLVGLSEEQLKASKDEIHWSWYIFGEGQSGEHILIDLALERLGRYYYSFWDRHAMIGCMPVIANSFTDLLVRMFENQGQGWYWEQPDFEPLGDAFD